MVWLASDICLSKAFPLFIFHSWNLFNVSHSVLTPHQGGPWPGLHANQIPIWWNIHEMWETLAPLSHHTAGDPQRSRVCVLRSQLLCWHDRDQGDIEMLVVLFWNVDLCMWLTNVLSFIQCRRRSWRVCKWKSSDQCRLLYLKWKLVSFYWLWREINFVHRQPVLWQLKVRVWCSFLFPLKCKQNVTNSWVIFPCLVLFLCCYYWWRNCFVPWMNEYVKCSKNRNNKIVMFKNLSRWKITLHGRNCSQKLFTVYKPLKTHFLVRVRLKCRQV